MSSEEIVKLFSEKGGEFVSPPSLFQEKVAAIRAFIFDWDGVFNDGIKSDERGSPFSETDAMGTNLLRYSWYLRRGVVPRTFIITGEENPAAQALAKREHFDGVFLKAKDKTVALNEIKDSFKLETRQIAFCFDDVLDLNVASHSGLRLFLDSGSNPLLSRFVRDNGLCDYVPFSQRPGAVREVAELMIGLNGNFSEVVTNRMQYSESYQAYLAMRNSTQLKAYLWDGEKFVTK